MTLVSLIKVLLIIPYNAQFSILYHLTNHPHTSYDVHFLKSSKIALKKFIFKIMGTYFL